MGSTRARSSRRCRSRRTRSAFASSAHRISTATSSCGFTISRDGRARNVTASGPSRIPPAALRCIRARSARWSFPAAVGRGDVELVYRRRVGVLGMLARTTPQQSLPAAPTDPDDPMSALGALMAQQGAVTPPRDPTPEEDAHARVLAGSIEIRSGEITRREIVRALAELSPRDCYVDELHRDPAVAGSPHLLIVVRTDGHVVTVTFPEPRIGSDTMRACIAARARTARFRGGPATIVVPVRLWRGPPLRSRP
jgi:hypothetical protein